MTAPMLFPVSRQGQITLRRAVRKALGEARHEVLQCLPRLSAEGAASLIAPCEHSKTPLIASPPAGS